MLNQGYSHKREDKIISRAISSTAQNKGLQTFPIRLISVAAMPISLKEIYGE